MNLLSEITKRAKNRIDFLPVYECLFVCFESLLEFVDATAGIDELLLAGIERMALRANFNLHLAALGGSGLNALTAGTNNSALFVVGMDSLFHFFHLR